MLENGLPGVKSFCSTGCLCENIKAIFGLRIKANAHHEVILTLAVPYSKSNEREFSGIQEFERRVLSSESVGFHCDNFSRQHLPYLNKSVLFDSL
jgi:hypothetical protein